VRKLAVPSRHHKGGQAHHIPPYDAIKKALGEEIAQFRELPSIWMETTDHVKTKSYGAKGKEYRELQVSLMERRGKEGIKHAIKMDIDDIRARFGSKHDDAIQQFLKSIPSSIRPNVSLLNLKENSTWTRHEGLQTSDGKSFHLNLWDQFNFK